MVVADRVVLELQAEFARYTANVDAARNHFDRRLSEMERRAKRSETAIQGSFGRLLAGAVIARGVLQVARYADAWTRVGRALQSTEQVFGVRLRSQEALVKMAAETRSDLESIVTLYTRTAQSTRDLGIAEADVARVTTTVAKALKLGSASASEQASVMLQLSQAFAKGKLDGDEFRTVMENATIIQKALSDRLGKTRGEIIKMAADGKLKVQDLVGALLDIAPAVDKAFARTTSTFGEAATNLETAVIHLSGKFLELSGIGEGLTGIMNELAGAINALAESSALAQFAENLKNATAAMMVFLQTGRAVTNEEINKARARVSLRGPLKEFMTGTQGPARQGAISGGSFNERFNAAANPVASPPSPEVDKAAASAQKKVESATRAIHERIEAMNLERKTMGESTFEIERRRIQLELEQQATAAGVAITPKLREEIEQLSTQYGHQAAMLEKVTAAYQRQQAAAQEAFEAAKQGFMDVILRGKSFGEVLSDLGMKFAEMLANQAFTSLFDPAQGSGSPFGAIFRAFGGVGGKATGGFIPRGKSANVGERGAEKVFATPGGAVVVPNRAINASRPGGGGSMVFAPVTSIDARGADQATEARLIAALDARDRQWREDFPAMARQAALNRKI